MMIEIPGVLDAAGLERVRAIIDMGDWIDGNATSGHQSALAKRNEQLPENTSAAREAGSLVLDALGANALFIAAALPLKVFPPLFSRYAGGQAFDMHVDGAVRHLAGTDFRIRTDLSATLFLTDPDSYEGGELIVEGAFGSQTVKLPAGHMLVYPSSSLHRVAPVTGGTRVASFFWIQSMVRDDDARRSLFELDSAIQVLSRDRGADDPAIVRLTGVYHNLMRRFAEL